MILAVQYFLVLPACSRHTRARLLRQYVRWLSRTPNVRFQLTRWLLAMVIAKTSGGRSR